MFGLSREDAAQRSAVEKVRETSFLPWEDGFAIQLKRGASPTFVNPDEKEVLVEAYAAGINRMMRWVMIGCILLLSLIVAVDVAFDLKPAFWQVLVAIAALIPVMRMPPKMMREAAETLPPRTRSVNESLFKRRVAQRLRDRPWGELLLPVACIPLLYWRTRPALPPATIDDYAEWLVLIALSMIMLWAISRKLRAPETM